MKHRYYFLPFMLPVALGAHSELVINEIMQSNIDCIMDDANEFPIRGWSSTTAVMPPLTSRPTGSG